MINAQQDYQKSSDEHFATYQRFFVLLKGALVACAVIVLGLAIFLL